MGDGLGHGQKIGAVPPFWKEGLGPHLTHEAWTEAYLRTKWHLDQSSHFATTDMGRKLGGL